MNYLSYILDNTNHLKADLEINRKQQNSVINFYHHIKNIKIDFLFYNINDIVKN